MSAAVRSAAAKSASPVRCSLRKQDKLTLKAEFAQVKASGQRVGGALLAVGAVRVEDGTLRAGVICGKKYSLLAVRRNRARRLVWESFRQLKTAIPPCRLVFIPRRRMHDAGCREVMAEMERHLKKLGLWRGATGASGPHRG